MNDREKYGIEKTPVVGTRILSHPMEHFQAKGNDAHALIVIDDNAGTFTSTNVYNPAGEFKLGRGYTRAGMTHPLPVEGDEKWKTWRRRGYEAVKPGVDFGGCIKLVPVTKKAEAKAEAKAPAAAAK